MRIVSVFASDNHPDTIHGVPWQAIFRIRNGTATRWFHKFRELIPLQEFVSAGNEGIVEAMRDYDHRGSAPFTVYLAKVLAHAMSHVVRTEWSGWVTYERSHETAIGPDGYARRTELRRLYHPPRLEPLPTVEIDDASDDHPQATPRPLHTTVPYEEHVYIQEGLQWLKHHINGKRLDYVMRCCIEDDMAEIARQDGITRQTVQKMLARVHAHVQRWAAA